MNDYVNEQAIEDPAIAEKKLKICQSCEHFLPENSLCDLCNCPLIPKIGVRGSKCIIDKWVFIEPPVTK